MGLDYDPLWDEQGQLRWGCTVREALAWLRRYAKELVEKCSNAVRNDNMPAGEIISVDSIPSAIICRIICWTVSR